MTEKKIVEPSRSRGRPLASMDERAKAEARQFGALPGGRGEPYLLWLGGFMCVLLAVVVLAAIASSYGLLQLGRSLPAVAAEQSSESPHVAGRSNCAEIGGSDLRSPSEGLWFQSSCITTVEPPLLPFITKCNRTSLDDGFTLLAPGLYVFRSPQSAAAFLWYGSAETCFDLVSEKIVTAVCADRAVSFKWNARSACSVHGGVLAMVNGR
jgi:hypothetical protein